MDSPFFKKQKDSTTFKINILQDFFKNYFGPIIMGLGHLVVIDPFCGPGECKDGHIGSPIVILKGLASYLLNEDKLKTIIKKNKKSIGLKIIFGDSNKANIEKLSKKIKEDKELNFFETKFNNTNIINFFVGDFEDCFRNNKITTKNKGFKKFIFLDPFNFSVRKITITQLMDSNSEILLFIPIHNITRFKNSEKCPQTFKDFIGDYIGDQKRTSTTDAIGLIKNNLSTNYLVREIEIDSGEKSQNKYCLLLITKHMKSLHIMNCVVYKSDERGIGYNKKAESTIKEQKKNTALSLFPNIITPTDLSPKFRDLIKNLKRELLKKDMSNKNIIEYIEIGGFPMINEIPKEVAKIIYDLIEENKIKIIHQEKENPKSKIYYLPFSNYDKKIEFIFSPTENE